MSDPIDIYNWRRIDARLTTSGQPNEEQLAEIQKLGVTDIINLGLREHERALADEGARASALGMRYVHIPVAFDQPTEDDFAKFCAAMADMRGATIHVHCIANMRVTAFLYRYQRDVLGAPDEHARAAMDSVWQPGGVWAKFIGDEASVDLPHRGPRTAEP
ncbi:MAG: protein tyrosine phosphatase family protein [Caulobacterales bacterium]